MERKAGVYIIVCLLAAFLASSCATGMRRGPVEDLTAEQVKGKIEERHSLVVVDTRSEYEYSQGHLPGAINIPPYKFNILSSLLPHDLRTEIVFYCRGYG